MDSQDSVLTQVFRPALSQLQYLLKGARMVGRFQMIDQRLSAHGKPFFDHHGRLLARQRVALNRITGVSQFDNEPLLQVLHQLGRQRSVVIQLGLLRRQFVPMHSKTIKCHFMVCKLFKVLAFARI